MTALRGATDQHQCALQRR